MLTDEEMERQADESAQAVAELELALLGMAASSMLALRSRREVAKSASELQRRATKAAADALPAIERAVQADCEAAMGASVAREASGESAKVADKARRDALKAAKAATKEGKAQAKRIARNMAKSCRQEYVRAAYMAMLKAGSAPGGDDFQKAVAQGVARMARKGLTATTYTRKDGVKVNVPCDVGIRRAVEAAGKERQRDQSIAVAKATTGLVYVNTTSGARESHRRWQGAVYRVVDLEPGDPNYAAVMKYPSFDAVVGDQMHDYNCRHRLRKWRDGRELPKDELEGTGYTQEQAYAARSRQRAMENDLRHLKREREVLDAAGLDGSDVTRRIRLKEQQLAAHVKKHGKVLKREKWRETTYGAERKRDNTYGRVWLNGAEHARVSSAMDRGVLVKQTPVDNGFRQFRRIKGEHTDAADLKAVNPMFEKEGSYRVNCQRCVAAYEMRRRGYDVVAKKSQPVKGSDSDSLQSKWHSMFRGFRPRIAGDDCVGSIAESMREWGEGSRAMVKVVWVGDDGKPSDEGHAFIAEMIEGAVVFKDPQTGEEGDSVEMYFQVAAPKRTVFGRIDNLEVTRIINRCCTSRK